MKIYLVSLIVLLLQGGFAEEATEKILDLQTKAFLALELGKEMVEAGELENAVNAYRRALAIYRGIREQDPEFKKETLDWRISLCGNEISRLTAELQRTKGAPSDPAMRKAKDGQPPPPPFTPTPIGGNPLPGEPETNPAASSPSSPAIAPEPVVEAIPAPRPQSPRLQAETEDLEYMSKYIALLEEMKILKQKMVIVQTREETSNVTIRRLSSQVDQLSSKDEDMMKTIQKLNTRNADLLDGLDQAKKNQSSTDKARQDLELEAAKLKTSLNTAAGNLGVTETKLRSLEAEFQENKKHIAANNRKVETMQTERDQETERANNLAVEMTKIKNESTAEHAKVADKIKILETQLAKTEKDRAAALQESEKNLITAHKHNMDLQSNSERAQAEAIKLKKELSTERAQTADKIESMETKWTAAKKERDTALEESQKSLVTAHKHNMDLLSDLELTQAEIASLKEAIAGISSETNALAKLRTELEEAQMAYEVQQAMLAGKEALLQGAEEDLGRLEELEKNYAEAEKARTTLQQQLDNQEKSLVALTDGDKSVQEHLKTLIAEKSDLSSQLDALKDRHALMTVDFSGLGGRLELAQAGQAKALSRIKDLQLTIAGERQEKGTLGKQLKQLEQNLEKNQASLDDAQKSAGGRLKEKTEVERLHARVLADQEKSLQSIRGELRAAREDADNWKAKTTDALAAQKAEKKAMDDVKRSSGSSARTIAGLQKALADQEENLNAKNAEISKIKSVLAKSNQSLETAKSEQEKLEKTLEQATSANEKSASSLVRERDEALRLLEAKEAEISDLKKKKESQKSKPILRRGARMNDVVPVPLLEQLGQMTPMIEIQAKGEAGFSVEYQGFGTIDLVLPE
ncbi:MAG: hypothetical protein VCG02_00810 [Verrucomicrobiota bacterium]